MNARDKIKVTNLEMEASKSSALAQNKYAEITLH